MLEPSNNHQTITPAEVPLTRKTTSGENPQVMQQPQRDQLKPLLWYQNKTTVFLLVLLVLVAVAVIFTLPRLVKPVSPSVNLPEPVENVTQTAVGPAESPWHEAQQAKARRQAQDILDRVLEKQSFLEKKDVESWATDDYSEALSSANQGDTAYRSRQYPEALQQYQQAEQQLSIIEQQIPQLLEESLALGNDALDNGDQKLATEMFARSLLLDPDNQLAQQGAARSETLEQINAFLEEAQQAEDLGNHEKAVEILQRALQVDPAHGVVAQRLELAKQKHKQQQFQQAMSGGYEALENGETAKASAAFRRALAINPNDEAANNGLQQANTIEATAFIETRLVKGSELEQQERWQQAVQQYQQILQRDASIIDARIGEIRSQARSKLDDQLQKILNEPARLATLAVRNQAWQLLGDARAIENPGDKLSAQILDLGQLLAASAKPVTVAIRSDNQTQVTVFKHAELGRFATKSIELTPGRYVAVGSRKGYRDVRVEFEVVGGKTASIEVICREPV